MLYDCTLMEKKKEKEKFQKSKPWKNCLYFRERNFLKFQETETLKNFLYFREKLSEVEK